MQLYRLTLCSGSRPGNNTSMEKLVFSKFLKQQFAAPKLIANPWDIAVQSVPSGVIL